LYLEERNFEMESSTPTIQPEALMRQTTDGRTKLRATVGDALHQAAGLDCPIVKYHLTRAHAVLSVPADRLAIAGD
jgi:hypothetical protein